MRIKILGLLGYRRHPTYWVHWSSRSGAERRQKWKSYLQAVWETVPRSPFNQRRNPPPLTPRGPSFVCPGRGSAAARAARGEPGAPGSASGRARRSRWAAHPSKQGLSIFRAEEATISRAERPPRLASLATPPVSPAPPGTGDSSHAGPATPRPRTPDLSPAPRGVAGAPRKPTALRTVTPQPPHARTPAPAPAAGRGSLAALPTGKASRRGSEQGGRPRRSPGRHPASPQLPVFVCKVSAGGEPTSARAQRRAAPSPALAPGGRGGTQRPNS